MTDNAFISAARFGRNEFWRYLLTIGLVIVLLFSGSLCLVVAVILVTGSINVSDLPAVPFLAVNLVPFLFALLGLWLGLRLIHGRPLMTLVNPVEGRFKWRRFALSAGIWLALAGLTDVIMSLLQPGNYVFRFEPERFFPYLAVAVLLLPIQSATEELVFRGYLTQGFGLKLGTLAAWLAPSILFALLHGANPEVGEYGALATLPSYLIIGLLLGLVTLRSESLELAIGLHVANNLYSALVVTFPSSVLNAPALFRIQVYDPLAALAAGVLMSVLYLVLIALTGKAFFRRGLIGNDKQPGLEVQK